MRGRWSGCHFPILGSWIVIRFTPFYISIPLLSSAVALGLWKRSGSNIGSSFGRRKAPWLVFSECQRQRDWREMEGEGVWWGQGEDVWRMKL